MTSKKPHPKFNVPNFGAKKRAGVKERWRKQRGVDNKKRVKKDFAGAEPTIGYRNPEELRGTSVNGKKRMLVYNIGQLREMLTLQEMKNYDVILAGELSVRKKSEIAKLAAQNKIRVTNAPKENNRQPVAPRPGAKVAPK